MGTNWQFSNVLHQMYCLSPSQVVRSELLPSMWGWLATSLETGGQSESWIMLSHSLRGGGSNFRFLVHQQHSHLTSLTLESNQAINSISWFGLGGSAHLPCNLFFSPWLSSVLLWKHFDKHIPPTLLHIVISDSIASTSCFQSQLNVQYCFKFLFAIIGADNSMQIILFRGNLDIAVECWRQKKKEVGMIWSGFFKPHSTWIPWQKIIVDCELTALWDFWSCEKKPIFSGKKARGQHNVWTRYKRVLAFITGALTTTQPLIALFTQGRTSAPIPQGICARVTHNTQYSHDCHCWICWSVLHNYIWRVTVMPAGHCITKMSKMNGDTVWS